MGEKQLCHMRDSGITPTITTFNILLKSCEKTANVRRAEKWFSYIEEAGAIPDVQTFNSLLETCSNQGLSRWLRWLSREDNNQQKWFFKMAEMGVHPNEATFEILTRCRFSVASLLPIPIVGALVLALLLHRRSSAT